MSRVRVVIHTTKESRGRVLAYELDKEMSTAWVLIYERRNIVNEARNENEWTLLRLRLDCNQILIILAGHCGKKYTHSCRMKQQVGHHC